MMNKASKSEFESQINPSSNPVYKYGNEEKSSDSNFANQPNSDSYILEDEESTIEENNTYDQAPEPGFGKTWSCFFRILLSPVQGWKEFRKLKLSSEKANSILLFPSLAIAAAIRFITLVFLHDHDIQTALPVALETFCGIFFGYFLVIILGKLLLPKAGREALDTTQGKNFISVIMTSLALFDSIYELFPMIQPVLVFLPLWTIFIINQGCRFLGIKEGERIRATTILSVLSIGGPLAIDWLFGLLLSLNI